jgi:hypothetical protein
MILMMEVRGNLAPGLSSRYCGMCSIQSAIYGGVSDFLMSD